MVKLESESTMVVTKAWRKKRGAQCLCKGPPSRAPANSHSFLPLLVSPCSLPTLSGRCQLSAQHPPTASFRVFCLTCSLLHLSPTSCLCPSLGSLPDFHGRGSVIACVVLSPFSHHPGQTQCVLQNQTVCTFTSKLINHLPCVPQSLITLCHDIVIHLDPTHSPCTPQHLSQLNSTLVYSLESILGASLPLLQFLLL